MPLKCHMCQKYIHYSKWVIGSGMCKECYEKYHVAGYIEVI